MISELIKILLIQHVQVFLDANKTIFYYKHMGKNYCIETNFKTKIILDLFWILLSSAPTTTTTTQSNLGSFKIYSFS